MNMTTGNAEMRPICKRCGYGDVDLQLIGCSCVLHARCTPLSLVITEDTSQYGRIPTPVKSNAIRCPICQTGVVNGIQLFSMSFSDLDRAIHLRKQKKNLDRSYGVSPYIREGERKRARDENDMDTWEVESSHLLLSHIKNQKNSRIGRWSSEEVSFADNLVSAFDQGYLPIPHGVKLNEFLGDMLLCKSSRLTKKMKNAKLSTRSFTLQNILTGIPTEVCQSLSALQESFLQSISSEPMRLELRFNMTKLWRTHFSNLCVQVGYELLNANHWLTSLEEMERRAADAEEVVRKARRRRMGLALRQDIGQSANAGVFIAGVSARNADVLPIPSIAQSSNLSTISANTSTNSQPLSSDSNIENRKNKADAAIAGSTKANENTAELLPNILDETSPRGRSLSEDFSIYIQDLTDPLTMVPPAKKNPIGDCGPFVEKVIRYIEKYNLPFQYVDVWVPSYLQDESSDPSEKHNSEENLRLYYSGHMTRSNIDSSLMSQLQEFGAYSAHFSFAPGMGMPGRIYVNGKPAWDDNICNAEPHHFERIGGAKVYGIQTAVGIPLAAPVVGRIILVLYSNTRVPEDQIQLQLYCKDFEKWTPEPRWKLVIELGKDKEDDNGQGKKASEKPYMEEVSPSLQHQSTMHNYSKKNESNASTEESNSLAPQSNLLEAEVEQQITTLLGHQMPLTENHTGSLMVQHYMSLRLLLLRSPDRRSKAEQESLNVIKRSYHGFSEDSNRTDSELASLLVRDWMFLSSANQVGINKQEVSAPAVPARAAHKCHVMQPTNLTTEITTGVPTVMPSPLMTSNLPLTTNQNVFLPTGQTHIVAYPSAASLETGELTKLNHRRYSFEDRSSKADTNSSTSNNNGEIAPTVVPET